MNTLIISSSLSQSSKSFILCKSVEKELIKKNVRCKLIDIRKIHINPYHINDTPGMEELKKEIEKTDNLIIGMGVHNYSINDSLKIILDNCFEGATGKLFGIICAAGGEKSYLSTMHLTQICMHEWRMIQLPRIIYATSGDFSNNSISSEEINKRIHVFCKEFTSIGEKLIS
tara:strand:- start:5472 stop:5987 length:516 start_codon:yes stop_codon:yes gene_type:complete